MTRPGPDSEVNDVDIIRVIVSARPPAYGTSDIADEFEISTEAIRRKLHRLERDGKLESAEVGGALVWWPTSEGRALLRED